MFIDILKTLKSKTKEFKMTPQAKIIMIIRVVILISFLVLALIIKNDITRYLINENIDKAKKSVQQLLSTKDTIEDNYSHDYIVKELENNNYNFFADYIISNIALNMSNTYDFNIRYISDTSRNPQNRLHQSEKKIFQKLKTKNIYEYYEVDKTVNMIKYARRLDISRDCLKCHGSVDTDVDNFIYQKLSQKYGDKSFNYKEGDMVGMVLVSMPMSLANETISQLGNTLLQSGAIIGFIFAGVLIFLINRYFDRDIIAPLDRVATVVENYNNDFTKTLPINKKNRELNTIALSFNLIMKNIQTFLSNFKISINQLSSKHKELHLILDNLHNNFKKQLIIKSKLEQQLKINRHLVESIKKYKESSEKEFPCILELHKKYMQITLKSNQILNRYKIEKNNLTSKDIEEIDNIIQENSQNILEIYQKINISINHNHKKDNIINQLLVKDNDMIDIFNEININNEKNFEIFKIVSTELEEIDNDLEKLLTQIDYFKV